MDFGQIFEFAIPFLERLPTVRAVLGFILVFFLPGFAWTLVFFKQINVMERIVLSFGLSIAMVTLTIIALNILLDIRTTGSNSILIIIILTIIPLAFYYIRRLIRGSSSGEA